MTEAGERRDVPCGKCHISVCQKECSLSMAEMQKILLNVVNNPVPKGFIYTQLPFHDSPTSLWPGLTWRNVTEQYAGLFFRAGGGTSSPFGQTQAESSNRFGSAQRTGHTGSEYSSSIVIPSQGWSGFVTASFHTNASDGWYKKYNDAIRFQNTGEETRPRNTAVLIWKRE